MNSGRRAARFTTSILLVGFVARTAGAGQVALKLGQYAMTITYEVQEQRQNESRTGTRCITAKDLDDPERIFDDRIATVKNDGECSVKNLKSAGARISYDAECSNRTVHVEGSLNETAFSVVRTVTPKASHEILLKFVVAGKRTGDCAGR